MLLGIQHQDASQASQEAEKWLASQVSQEAEQPLGKKEAY